MPERAREWGALDVKRATHSGRVSRNEWHAVGAVAGLLLQVTPGQAKSWLLRTTIGSARRSVGLGAYPENGLATARDKARAAKAQIEIGLDPIEERKAARAALAAARRRNLTFTEAADLWIEAKLSRCLIPWFDGAILSQEWKEATWDKFVTGAPRPRTPSEQQYSDRKLRSRS